MPAATGGGAAAEPCGRPAELSAAAAALERCIGAAATAVAQQAARLDEADSRVGDGDCGSTLKLAADAIQEVGSHSKARDGAQFVGLSHDHNHRALAGLRFRFTAGCRGRPSASVQYQQGQFRTGEPGTRVHETLLHCSSTSMNELGRSEAPGFPKP
jgi:hypothetical protein